jgi:hypothetical protein
MKMLSNSMLRAICTQRLTGAHGLPASANAKGKDLIDLVLVGNWLVQVLDVLGVFLRRTWELEFVSCVRLED